MDETIRELYRNYMLKLVYPDNNTDFKIEGEAVVVTSKGLEEIGTNPTELDVLKVNILKSLCPSLLNMKNVKKN